MDIWETSGCLNIYLLYLEETGGCVFIESLWLVSTCIARVITAVLECVCAMLWVPLYAS